VLLLGLGDGVIARHLAARCKTLTVLEGASALIGAFSAPGNVRVVHTLFEDFTADFKADAVVATHVLEHVRESVQLIHQSKEWLNDNGLAVFTVPNGTSLHRRIGHKMGLLETPDSLGPQDHRIGHLRVYTAERLHQELMDANFHITTLHGYMVKVVPSSVMRTWERTLLDAMYELSLELPASDCSSLIAVCTTPA